MKLRYAAISMSAALILTSALPISVSATETPRSSQLDWSIPALYTLGHCVSQSDLDCVGSVGIVDESGKYWPGNFSSESFNDSPNDQNGNKQSVGSSQWTVKVGDKNITVGVSPNAETPTHACCSLGDGTLKRFGAIRTFINVDNPLTTKVRFTLRTSWIKPLNVPLYASQASFSESKIAGGRLWTFEGKGTETHGYYSDFAGKLAANKNADWDNTVFYFTIDHAGETDALSPFPKTCSEVGYTGESSNASSAGMPFWDEKSQSLDFAIAAPHASSSGAANIGFFNFWATDAYLDCKWPGNSISKSSSVTVQVFNEDGTAQVAVTSVNHKDGKLFVSATGFHYSSPTIKVTAGSDSTASTPEPTATPTPSPTAAPRKAKTRVCVSLKNSRLTRTLRSTSLKCPAGFKAKG